MDFTAMWGWPQWTLAILLFLGLVMNAGQHGKPRLQTSGPDKGQPEEYNAFIAIIRVAMWLFILVCGGFFA